MSQIHHLEVSEAAMPVETLAGAVHDVAAATGLVAKVTGPGALVDATLTLTSGLWVSVSLPVITGADPFVADFGLARAASIEFQVDGARDPEPQLDDMLALVFALLDRLPGDAVLHYEYAEVWLVRQGGQLVLNDSDDLWPPERLARVPRPYQQAPLAFSNL